MPSERTDGIEDLLERHRRGDPAALDELFRLLYDELRRLARRQVGSEQQAPTAAPTALVHDVYLRLRGTALSARDEHEFTNLVGKSLRHALIDAARRRRRVDGPDLERLPNRDSATGDELPWLMEALEKLEALDRELYEVVHLRFLAGRSVEDTAQLLGLSEPTVKRRWQLARAWLRRQREQTR